MSSEEHSNMFVEVLCLLALDPEEQIGCFPSFVVVADEIALTFGDSYQLVEQSVRKGEFGESKKIAEIESIFNEMSGVHENWTLEALRKGIRWQRVRTIARDILQEIGTKPRKPSLSWISYSEG